MSDVEINTCQSCHYPVAAKRPNTNLTLCDICNPWVDASLSRTAGIPSWGRSFNDRTTDFDNVHRDMQALNSEQNEDWHVLGGATNTPSPFSERGWVDFIGWALEGSAEDVIAKVRWSVEARERSTRTNSHLLSVSSIRTQLKLIDEQCHVAGHLVTVDKRGQIWINDGLDTVLFGSTAFDLHCQRTDMLADLLFDRFHGLEQRPIEELAYIYWREPWMSMIDTITAATEPITPIIRETFSRMANGALGEIVADRCRMAILLWSSHVEREFLTCSRSAWAKSFQWVRELVEEMASYVTIGADGLYVDGESGNLYRIGPEEACATGPRYALAVRSGDHFEVRKVARVGNEMTKPICIHVDENQEGGQFEVVMGDIVAALILALRDDLKSAESIVPLFRELPLKYQSRDRPGDRTRWRQRLRDRSLRRLRRREEYDAMFFDEEE
ncbi:MAG: hypothetical protein QF440_02270 [Candidatus Thalassarchaeaceae archaeon]|jgi:hypothetical protein|nr:hypothetical protein [Candidatus Thalassarchaeaceae archaeon]